MKIDVTKLAEGQAIRFTEEWDPQACDLNAPGLKHKGLVRIEATAKRNSSVVEADVCVASTIILTCARCFREFQASGNKTFKLVYSIDLSKKTIQLDSHVREELILGYPQKALCRPECRGLCSRCGADLNESACSCKRNEK